MLPAHTSSTIAPHLVFRHNHVRAFASTSALTMGPKGKSRAHYSHPQPSDYETDAPANVDIPPPPLRSNEELNLSVIRRHYPEVIAVHCVAPYAVLYAFSLDSEQWEKVGMEGSLFVCELLTAPNGAERYSVVILNRRSLDNFNMEITGLDGLEFTEDYIIMQGDQVYGLWIFSEPPPSSTANTRAEMVAKIQELAVGYRQLFSKELVLNRAGTRPS